MLWKLMHKLRRPRLLRQNPKRAGKGQVLIRQSTALTATGGMAVPSMSDVPHHSPDQLLSLRSSVSPPAAAHPVGRILPFVPHSSPPDRVEDSAACEEGAGRRNRLWGGGAKSEYRRLRSVSERQDRKGQQRRPRWYLCVLGAVRVPATTDMGEIRSRMQRRLSAVAGEESPGDTGRGAWKLLRSLSCAGLESAAAVTSPVRSAAQARGT